MYVVECLFRTKDKRRIFKGRTSILLRKLWDLNRFWNSESPSIRSRVSHPAVQKARRTFTVVSDWLTSYRLWLRHS
jgi:hypothetical protein